MEWMHAFLLIYNLFEPMLCLISKMSFKLFNMNFMASLELLYSMEILDPVDDLLPPLLQKNQPRTLLCLPSPFKKIREATGDVQALPPRLFGIYDDPEYALLLRTSSQLPNEIINILCAALDQNLVNEGHMVLLASPGFRTAFSSYMSGVERSFPWKATKSSPSNHSSPTALLLLGSGKFAGVTRCLASVKEQVGKHKYCPSWHPRENLLQVKATKVVP
jgi:hypothetical protein